MHCHKIDRPRRRGCPCRSSEKHCQSGSAEAQHSISACRIRPKRSSVVVITPHRGDTMAAAKLRKRCEICKRWYRPDAKVKDRQRACRRKDCQRELHRRACSRYNARERIGNHVKQLSSRLKGDPKADPPPTPSTKYQTSRHRRAQQTGDGVSPATTRPSSSPDPPIPGVDWKVVELHFGLDHAVLLEVFARALVSFLHCRMTQKSQTGVASTGGARHRPDRDG